MTNRHGETFEVWLARTGRTSATINAVDRNFRGTVPDEKLLFEIATYLEEQNTALLSALQRKITAEAAPVVFIPGAGAKP